MANGDKTQSWKFIAGRSESKSFVVSAIEKVIDGSSLTGQLEALDADSEHSKINLDEEQLDEINEKDFVASPVLVEDIAAMEEVGLVSLFDIDKESEEIRKLSIPPPGKRERIYVNNLDRGIDCLEVKICTGGAAITCNLVEVSSQLPEEMMSGSLSWPVFEMDWSKLPGISETSVILDAFKEQEAFDYNSFVVIHGGVLGATKVAGVSDERQGSESKSVVELTNGSSEDTHSSTMFFCFCVFCPSFKVDGRKEYEAT
ncbi:unnamed protein product [Lactuca saligna]|uniref:Uncharacterized protein n=1 Tax=Lactuca saligna TaxID=75948 RepID=A0AA35US83_LACSI|nr:unnamed protein product [Lactuca saligna]